MKFNSITEIKSHFHLEGSDDKLIKKKLKRIIRNNHPDKNGGEFKNDIDEQLYHEAKDALDCLNKQDQLVISPNNADNLTLAVSQALKALALTKEENAKERILENTESNLTNKIQQSIIAYHNKYSAPKITSIAIATVLTGLWIFPNAIKDNPLLSQLSNYYKELTVLWLISLMFNGYLWMRIKFLEKQDEQIKKNYKLESTQNKIFNIFILWEYIIDDKYSFREDTLVINFNKEMLMDFLIRRYTYFNDRFHHLGPIDIWLHKDEIKDIERKFRDYSDRKHDQKTAFASIAIGSFMPMPGEIDIELAETICDLIIGRLVSKNIISRLNDKQLSDTYEYIVL
jgi:hypothetical protein